MKFNIGDVIIRCAYRDPQPMAVGKILETNWTYSYQGIRYESTGIDPVIYQIQWWNPNNEFGVHLVYIIDEEYKLATQEEVAWYAL